MKHDRFLIAIPVAVALLVIIAGFNQFRVAFLSRQLDTPNVAMQLGITSRGGQDAYVELTLLPASSVSRIQQVSA